MKRAKLLARSLPACLSLLALAAAFAQTPNPAPAAPQQRSETQLLLDTQDRIGSFKVERDGQGNLQVYVPTPQGNLPQSPQAFFEALYHQQQEQKSSGFLFVVLNITSYWGLLWVSVGFIGQFLFTGRMIIQWLVSEREKKSIVPPTFWWFSLIGGAMLLVYFIWRKDIVGVIGQSTGVVVYARNLRLIHKQQRKLAKAQALAAASTPAPPST